MRAYHRTANAQAILADGFRDGEGTYLTDRLWRGVWVSASPFAANEGVTGTDLLAVDMPDAVFERYEWVEEGKPYREALIPAVVINGFPVETVSADEEEEQL
jgi:hypothetical protein